MRCQGIHNRIAVNFVQPVPEAKLTARCCFPRDKFQPYNPNTNLRPEEVHQEAGTFKVLSERTWGLRRRLSVEGSFGRGGGSGYAFTPQLSPSHPPPRLLSRWGTAPGPFLDEPSHDSLCPCVKLTTLGQGELQNPSALKQAGRVQGR